MRKREVISIYEEGSTMFVVLPSFPENGYGGRIIVKMEKLGDDLFVTHECDVTAKGPLIPCGCVEAAVNAYLEHTNDVYDDIVLEHHRVVLTPEMIISQIK